MLGGNLFTGLGVDALVRCTSGSLLCHGPCVASGGGTKIELLLIDKVIRTLF